MNGKLPATKHSFKDATTDIDAINAWWSKADYNLALCPEDAGWCVVDPDAGPGKVGEGTLANLLNDQGASLPDTYTVRTPGGGRHIYFDGSLPSTVGTDEQGLGPNLDTRGVGGYVLVPPSVIDGRAYEVLNDTDIAGLPSWIAARIRRTDERHAAAISDLDTGAALARARHLLSDCVVRGDIAVEGRGGDHRTYQIACELLNLGLSPEMALSLLEEIWNPACRPPWTHDELGVKIENASRYAQNEPGAWGVAPASEIFVGQALDKLVAESKGREHRSRFYPEDDDEMEQTPAARWLVEDVLQAETTAMVYGPTQSFKSFLALDLGLAIATGKETFGATPKINGPVFYAALEGRLDIKRSRRKAWRIARNVSGLTDFYVMVAPMLIFPEEVQEFGDQIRDRLAGRKPALIILETVSKMMVGLDATHDAPRFVRFCDSLVESFGCTVLAVHHTGHDATRGPRDSSAYQAGFDTVLEVVAHRATKAVEVHVRKHKDQEERATPFTFEGKVVGPSLVFQPTNTEEHKALTGKTETLDPRAVGHALQALHAFGVEEAVTSHVLASELVPLAGDPDERGNLINKTARSLGALSRSRLEAYCERSGKELKWFLPAPA